MAAALLLGPGPWDPAERAALERRLALAGVAVRAVAPPAGAWRPRLLLAALAGAEGARSWLVCRDRAAVPAAASAGLAGVVLVGDDGDLPEEPALVVARAESLADAPRAMVPRTGGCWHDHRG